MHQCIEIFTPYIKIEKTKANNVVAIGILIKRNKRQYVLLHSFINDIVLFSNCKNNPKKVNSPANKIPSMVINILILSFDNIL